MTKSLLSIQNLTMKFSGLLAVDNLSFDVNGGEITAIIGPNGAGKTTVFNCMTGFYKPTSGQIIFSPPERKNVLFLEKMDSFKIPCHHGIVRTFQNIRLFKGMTVLENLIVAQHNMLMQASGFCIFSLLGMKSYTKKEKEAFEYAQYWLEKFNLLDQADQLAGSLPYGMQRKLEIARAMCVRPSVLCLDEPAAGLNPKESSELSEILSNICSQYDIAVVIIEHDMNVVMNISHHVVVLDYGKKISDGTPGFVQNDPLVIQAYLGIDGKEEQHVKN